VHGPLNLISILDLWRDIRPHEEVPESISYRTTSPLYAGDEYRIVLEEGDCATQGQILGPDGVAMKADIRGSPVL
jgi:hydroxyacyl-ACP dehydratase HTD2-like protein with hotdog domain